MVFPGRLTPLFLPDLLGGVTVLEGLGRTERGDPVSVRAVPYHAWANRERGAMRVWVEESE